MKDRHTRRCLGLRVCGPWQRVLISILAVALVGCALPWREYVVSPAISGSIQGIDLSPEAIDLRLNVAHRESLNLHDVQRIHLSLGEDEFSFEPVQLAVAGREYSKVYRVYLRYRSGAESFVIWRGEFSRFDLNGAIDLECDLNRPPRLGQPCQVREPLQHPWLVNSGERTFNRLCATCHGEGGARPVTVSGEQKQPPDLTQITSRRGSKFDAQEVAEWIEGSVIPTEHGTRSMPIWGERLSDEYSRYANAEELVGATLDPVIVYLRSIQR